VSILQRIWNDQRGFSLMEMMVAVALIGIIVPIFGPMMVTTLRTTDELSANSQVLDELRLQLATINRELRSAECFSSPAGNASGSTLRFTTAADFGLGSNAAPVAYTVVGTELIRTQGGETRVVGTNLVGPAQPFRQITSPRRSIEIRLDVRVLPNDPVQRIETVVAGRNAWRTC
jgi:prepilin-type N-terminal cleavage/methylation domain-containing protein